MTFQSSYLIQSLRVKFAVYSYKYSILSINFISQSNKETLKSFIK